MRIVRLAAAAMLLLWASATTAAVTAPRTSSLKGSGATASISASVDAAQPWSDPIPPDFASFSVEVPCPLRMIIDGGGSGGTQPRESYLNLLRYLRDLSGTNVGPNIRIGGNSADETWYAPNKTGVSPPLGNRYVVSDEDINAFAYVTEWDGSLTPDLNLRSPANASNPAAYAKAIVETVAPRGIAQFEIGNEPELFSGNGIRPHEHYTYDDWVSDWTTVAEAVNPVVDVPRLQGAVFCCTQWDHDLFGYMANFTTPERPWLATVSHHYYPMGSSVATIDKLLSPHSVDVRGFAPFIRAARSHGLRFVMGESNSAFDGGRYGVSNTFASTLWGMDVMFNGASVNFSRWNFHGCTGGAYTPIDTETHPWATPRPLYYGMAAFTYAVARNARIVPLSYDPEHTGVVLWMTYADDPDRIVVIALHKNASVAIAPMVSVTVALGGACSGRAASLKRGFPSSGEMNATTGISVGGLTFDNSTDGYPRGTPVSESLSADSSGAITFTVRPASFAAVEIEGCRPGGSS